MSYFWCAVAANVLPCLARVCQGAGTATISHPAAIGCCLCLATSGAGCCCCFLCCFVRMWGVLLMSNSADVQPLVPAVLQVGQHDRLLLTGASPLGIEHRILVEQVSNAVLCCFR